MGAGVGGSCKRCTTNFTAAHFPEEQKVINSSPPQQFAIFMYRTGTL